MSDLFSALATAAHSLEAHRLAMDVTGQNISNVNTPGYSRRVVDFAAIPPETRFGAGRGVEATGIRAQRDRLIERRLEQETSAMRREAAVADLLGLAEVALGQLGDGLDARLNEFFASFSRLADAPTSPVARQEVVLQGATVAAAFGETASKLADLQRDADRRLTTSVREINELAARIAELNASLGEAVANGGNLHIQDEQALLVKELSALANITVIQRSDGGLDIDIAGGRTLVVGNTAYALTATTTGPAGHVAITMDGDDISGQITGGTIGGLLYARDVRIPEYLRRLDEQAFALAEAVNTIHEAAFDPNGNTGQPFFAFSTPPTGTAGAASALIVDPVVAADPSRVAAAQAALPGDNRAAREMANLRDALLLDGGTATLIEGWSQLVYQVGRDVQSSNDERTLRGQIVTQMEMLRDQVSGISLDEEAMNLVRFQRAYEASARLFQVIDEALATLLNLVGR